MNQMINQAELRDESEAAGGSLSIVDSSGVMSVEAQRATADTQARMAIAKRFPRQIIPAYNKIMEHCSRFGLASKSQYKYQKGGTAIVGPSIRLAEMLAQTWGNIDFGWVELSRNAKSSSVMAYCQDLETNTVHRKIFDVEHCYFTKTSGKKYVTDPREVYEIVANNAARRLRSCIIACIPIDILEDAIMKCNETIKAADAKLPLVDRIRKMVRVFAEIGYSQDVLEAAIGKPAENFTPDDIKTCGQYWTALSEGASPSDVFPTKQSEKPEKSEAADKVKDAAAKGRQKKAAAETQPEKQADAEPAVEATVESAEFEVAGQRRSVSQH